MARRIPTGQQIDWQNLPLYWKEVEDLVRDLERLWEMRLSPTDLTARAFDEAQTSGIRTYIEATRYLTVAIDNHEALLSMLSSNGATVWAPWSLVRPMFESSFLAAWVLDPDDGLARRRRGLHLEVQDAKQQRLWLECFEHVPEMSKVVRAQLDKNARGSGATYKAEAAELGVRWDQLGAAVSVFDQLPKLSAVQSQGRSGAAFVQSTWRMLSGYEHGLMYAALGGSTQSAEVHIPGGKSVQLVISDDAIVNALKITYFLFLTAGRLFVRRCNSAD